MAVVPRLVKCPQCGTLAEYRTDNAFRPFCSERCKLIDLGAWAEERYAIAGAPLHGSSADPLSDMEGGDPADPDEIRQSMRRLYL